MAVRGHQILGVGFERGYFGLPQNPWIRNGEISDKGVEQVRALDAH